MAVFGVYVPTARHPLRGLAMEKFPSQEVAGWCLLERTADRTGRTWYLRDLPGLKGVLPSQHPRQVWETADETGYMRVWIRRNRDGTPRPSDTPDEEWLVGEGGKRGRLVRLPWEDLDATPVRQPAGRTGAGAGSAPTRRVNVPQAAVCRLCFQAKAVNGACGCPDTSRRYVVERPSRAGWQTCEACGGVVTAYARCGCS